MRNKHLSSVEKKVTELLATEDLVVTCITSFKQNMISQHSINVKVLDSCRGFCGGMKNEHLSSVEKKSTNCLQLKTWLQLV